MNYTILCHPDAEKEFISAYLWYEERLDGLGERFSDAVEKQIKFISYNPEYYQLKKQNYQESKTDIFPYSIVFKFYKRKKKFW